MKTNERFHLKTKSKMAKINTIFTSGLAIVQHDTSAVLHRALHRFHPAGSALGKAAKKHIGIS